MDDLLILESKTGQGFNEKVLQRGMPIIEKELENIFQKENLEQLLLITQKMRSVYISNGSVKNFICGFFLESLTFI